MTSRGLRLLRWLMWLVCLLVACYALWLLAKSDYDETFDRPIFVLLAADTALGVVLYLGPGCLDPRRFPARMSAVLVPGTSALLVQLLVGFLLFPATLVEGESPDRSWYGVVALLVLALGLGAVLLAVVTFALVIGPVATIATRSRVALRGDPDARYAVACSAVLLLTVVVAVCVAAIDPVGGRSGLLLRGVLLLLGVSEAAGGRDAVAWLGRAALLALVLALVLMARARRRLAATGVDPDRPSASV
ncbi:hypothetical protein [Nocardioides sp. cx-173]|uniref:hypothetical protein n=1 Tax=Nocardioides sp. cx-173 TaxID=2898796 RepID=UPI001E5427A7|nr:hypothetical protein [Nocardioides sp. cx-173]MCD4526451.1 hypothetical protein [Nocardioides sp. cx-173]UGB41140.1 hypothetical protein LQ940_17430 [Nocardioides sp. cx-173]